MKKVTGVVLALTVILLAVIPIDVFAEGASVSESDAVSTARTAFMEACGFTESDLEQYIMRVTFEDRSAKGQDSTWIVSFEYDTPYDLGFIDHSIVVSASDGKVQDLSDTKRFVDFISGFRDFEVMALAQEDLEREKGPYRNWSDAEKAAISEKFSDSSFAKAEQLPLPEDMQLWEAAELAKKAIIEKYGATSEEIDKLKLRGNFFAQEEPRAWTIGFSDGGEVKYAVTVLSPDGTIKMVDKY